MTGAVLSVIKVVHSAVFLALLASLLVFVQPGLGRHSDRIALVSGGLVAAEALVFCANGRRCPLRQMAEAIGEERGSVTDLFLPRWVAEHIFEISSPLFALGLVLQSRALRARAPRRQLAAQ